MIAPSPARSAAAQNTDTSTVRTFRRVFERNRLLILGLPIIALIAASASVLLSTPVYEATAVIRIDQERSNLAVLDALQELSTGSQINTEMAELRSRSTAEAVVEALNLGIDLEKPRRVTRSEVFADVSSTRATRDASYRLTRTADSTFKLVGPRVNRVIRIGERVDLAGFEFVLAPEAASHDELLVRAQPFPRAVSALRRVVTVGRPDREASILEIRYEGTDPQLAQQVPNEVARQFISNRNRVRKIEANSTVRFLNEQIDTLGAQLRTAETGMLAFRQGQRVISPEAEGESQVTRLVEFKADRDRLEAERIALAGIMTEADRNPDASAYRRLIGVPSLLRNPAAPELLRSINDLENQRAELLRTRTAADPAVSALTQRIRQTDAQLRAITETHLEALSSQINSLDGALSQFASELNRIPAKEIELARFRRQTEVTEEIYVELQTRLKEAEIAAAVADPSVRILDPAIYPLKPIRPNKPLSLSLALMLGLMVGIGLAFAREHLDDTIRSREELQELSGNIPVLGLVPRIQLANGDRRSRRQLFAVPLKGDLATDLRRTTAGRDTRGPVAEAYRTLRTNIAFTQSETPAKVLVVTSALPGEGKSTSSCNLAISLAQQGLRVLLVDGDLRRGALNKAFGVPAEPGLSNLLLGRAPLAEVVKQIEVEGVALQFIPTGTLPPNPAELLASSRATILLDELRPAFDAVVIDSAPLNIVTDAAIIGSRADGVLLVARSAVTERTAYRHAVEQLDAVRARVLGCVLNDVDGRTVGYYGQRAGAGYYASAQPAGR